MDYAKVLQALGRLNEYELLGKEYRRRTGHDLTHGQFMTLTTQYGAGIPLELLDTPEFRQKQTELETKLHAHTLGSLSEAGFFQEDAAMEIEQLPRYIHIPSHRHGFVECSYVLRGCCTQKVSGNAYRQTEGTFSIITTGTEHELLAEEDCICLTLKIRNKAFLNLKIPNMPVFAAPVYVECGSDPFLRNRMLELYCQQKEQLPYRDILMESIFTSMLVYLCQAYHDGLHYFLPGSVLQDTMLEVAVYMFENHATVTLHSLAQHFHYSDAYLSSLFRKKTGTTFTETLRAFKLGQARNLLLTTSLKLGEICEQVGYRDTSLFIRDFKNQFGLTPIQFRKEYQLLDT